MKGSSPLECWQCCHAFLHRNTFGLFTERRTITEPNAVRRLNGHSIYVKIESESAAIYRQSTSLAPRRRRLNACLSQWDPTLGTDNPCSKRYGAYELLLFVFVGRAVGLLMGRPLSTITQTLNGPQRLGQCRAYIWPSGSMCIYCRICEYTA